MLGNRVTVQVSAGAGDDSRLVVAGQPGLTYGGSARTHISGATSTGSAVWVSTFAQINGESSLQGPLVRLNAALTPTTPPAVLTSPVLSRSEDVWSDGRTLWVATGVLTHSLVCLAASSRPGPVVTLPVSGQVVALAAARQHRLRERAGATRLYRAVEDRQLSGSGRLPVTGEITAALSVRYRPMRCARCSR